MYNSTNFKMFCNDFLQATNNLAYVPKLYKVTFPTKKLCLEFIQSLSYCKSIDHSMLYLEFNIEETNSEFNISNNMLITSNQINSFPFRELEGNNYNFIHNNFKNDAIKEDDYYCYYDYFKFKAEKYIKNSKVVSMKFPYFHFDININHFRDIDKIMSGTFIFNSLFYYFIFLLI